MMKEFLAALGTTATAMGANAVLLGILAFLFRSFMNNRLEKDLIEFKATLERKASAEYEVFRSSLEKERLRLQISYGGIFEKQANAILELYNAVLNVQMAIDDAVHCGGEFDERHHRFMKPLSVFALTHEERRILLPVDIDKAVADFLDSTYKSVSSYISADSRDFSRVPADEMEKLCRQLDENGEIISKKLPELKEQMIVKMRQVLGTVA